jgi:D-amino-acid dehydrogenase
MARSAFVRAGHSLLQSTPMQFGAKGGFMRVCVLGAGIAGLAAAYELQRDGHEVTVVDSASPGGGASAANGAQLSYEHVQPLASPDLWRQLPGLLLAADSPLKLHPRWDWRQWWWGLQFLAACRASVARSSTAQLLALAAESRASFDRLLDDEHLQCDFSATGKLVIHSDGASLAAARNQLALQRGLGSRQEAVSGEECLAIEPALHRYRERIAGGIFTPGECAADCHKVCRELHGIVRQRGGRFVLEAQAHDLVQREGRVVAVTTSAGPIEADSFVVALGTGSSQLARRIGLYLPVYPLKGYSITLDIGAAPSTAPVVSVTDAARKVVFARIGNRLRVAGMAELVGHDTAVHAGRIASLRASAREVFPDCGGADVCAPWAGLRPATPTGLPIIGPHRKGPVNLIFNTGHGALGFTLAFGSASRIARMLRAYEARLIPVAAGPASCNV